MDEDGREIGERGAGGVGPEGGELIDAADFLETFGEPLDRTLDLDTWRPGQDLGELYQRLEAAVRRAVALEEASVAEMRRRIFAWLRGRPGAPPGAGVYRVSPERLEQIHRGLLFNGGVEACDGTSAIHD
ncbi:MAG TPA: hypothetical protein VIN09_02180, partial [Chloroflexota bacterium]